MSTPRLYAVLVHVPPDTVRAYAVRASTAAEAISCVIARGVRHLQRLEVYALAEIKDEPAPEE